MLTSGEKTVLGISSTENPTTEVSLGLQAPGLAGATGGNNPPSLSRTHRHEVENIRAVVVEIRVTAVFPFTQRDAIVRFIHELADLLLIIVEESDAELQFNEKANDGAFTL